MAKELDPNLEGGCGVSNLADAILDCYVDKSLQNSDWSLLKDSPEQQEYAALDSYLHPRLYLELVRLTRVARKEGKINNPDISSGSKVQLTYRNKIVANNNDS